MYRGIREGGVCVRVCVRAFVVGCVYRYCVLVFAFLFRASRFYHRRGTYRTFITHFFPVCFFSVCRVYRSGKHPRCGVIVCVCFVGGGISRGAVLGCLNVRLGRV